MEVQDGFIVGIYNYCDSWCEPCQFTSRCRVFADGAKHEAIRLMNEGDCSGASAREARGRRT